MSATGGQQAVMLALHDERCAPVDRLIAHGTGERAVAAGSNARRQGRPSALPDDLAGIGQLSQIAMDRHRRHTERGDQFLDGQRAVILK